MTRLPLVYRTVLQIVTRLPRVYKTGLLFAEGDYVTSVV